ncbi:peptidoglycan-binding domain-containing protein [Actinomycetospora aeridis]|uniref:Peptidoglycan-binding domain-containing protein n=1 Tax=Actinomycetospora aeridis TaxID=3129231 RepID=A0ABU8N179_9PSEU
MDETPIFAQLAAEHLWPATGRHHWRTPTTEETPVADAAAILRAGGIVADPGDVIAAAQASGLPLPAMAPKLKRESYGGRNVIGNDRVEAGGAYSKGGDAGNRAVTEAYLRWRGPAGKHRNRQQGWGPSQLTWAEFQDQAEREGGLHVPRVNMIVGARELARCFRAGGSWREAGALYNGGRSYAKSIDAAKEYGRWLEAAVDDWERRLSGVVVPPGQSGGGSGRRTLREGDSGPDVAELQRVLAAWYPDLRLVADGQFGPATKRSVEHLQRNARLTVDGVAGPQVFRTLNLT